MPNNKFNHQYSKLHVLVNMHRPSVDCSSLTGIIIEEKKIKNTDFWQSHCPKRDD